MNRSPFPVSVSGGTAYSESVRVDGPIHQLRWHAAADTGQIASIDLTILPDTVDTGPGWSFYARAAANVATQFVAVPTQEIHDAAAASDTGYAPIVAAGDRIRLTVTPDDTGVAFNATCYLWHG